MTIEARLRTALERIANSEIPGVSGGPHGPSAQVMEFAARALAFDRRTTTPHDDPSQARDRSETSHRH